MYAEAAAGILTEVQNRFLNIHVTKRVFRERKMELVSQYRAEVEVITLSLQFRISLSSIKLKDYGWFCQDLE